MSFAAYKFEYGKLAVSAVMLLTTPCVVLAKPFEEVSSWAYQLTGYEEGGLDDLVASSAELVVIDLTKDGVSEYFQPEDIHQIKANGKQVLAYFEIGGIEDYRPEWSTIAKDLKAGAVDDWPREQYVKYWDERWWPVVRSRVDQAIDAGYDGAFLDLLTAYIEIPNTDMSDEERAKLMVKLVIRLSDHAKSRQAGFKIVPQNCPELATWSHWKPRINHEYLAAIDGIAIESPYYMAHDKPCKASWCRENRQDALAVKHQGKVLLGVDYAKKENSIRHAYALQQKAGFVPYVSVIELNRYFAPPKEVIVSKDN